MNAIVKRKRPATVMVVDDSKIVRNRLVNAIAEDQYVILISEDGLTAFELAMDADCTDYATKPIDRKTLLSLIASYAQQHHAAPVANELVARP